jgi:EmrB/QacA subfamily drug resistance transporter
MLLVAGTMFMEILDGTILGTAAPSMARTFGVESAEISVAITAYLVTLAVLIPLSGWLTERWGSRTTFVTAIAVFTVSSAACATAGSLWVLVALRVVQGTGAAMMVPVGRLIVLRSTEKADLIRTIAYLSWPALVAPIIAPLAGGLFTTYLSWRWIFLVNLPLGLLALVTAWRIVPQLRETGRPALDSRGFLETAVCLSAVVVCASLIGDAHIDWVGVALSAAVAGIAGLVAVRHLLHREHPLLDLRLLKIPTFRVAQSSGSAFRLAINAMPFLLPLLFQDGFGWSPVKSGAVLLSLFVGNLGIKPFTTWMLRRWGFRLVLLAALVTASLTIFACGWITAGTRLPLIVLLLGLSGVARSVGFTAYTTLAFVDVDRPSVTAANTLTATVFQLSLGIGVALASVALRIGQNGQTPFGGGPGVAAFRLAFILMALLTLSASYGPYRLAHDAGKQVLGR